MEDLGIHSPLTIVSRSSRRDLMISLPPVSEEMACNATLWKRFTYSTCSNQILENSIKLFFERELCQIRSTGTKIVNCPYLPLLMQLL